MSNSFFKINLYLISLVTASSSFAANTNTNTNTNAAAAAQAVASPQPVPLIMDQWHILSYNKIPPNQVSAGEGSLKIAVDKSAGPLVHQLSTAAMVSGFDFKLVVTGSKKQELGPFDEDSVLRLGLVVAGSKTLSGPKRWFAADWVQKLFALAPAGSGLDKIYFFNITNRSAQVGQSRVHPKSDLIHESVVQLAEVPGTFNVTHRLPSPLKTLALWVSIDGDDTGSQYQVELKDLNLMVTP